MSADPTSLSVAPQTVAIHLWHATSSTAQPGPIETTCQRWLSTDEIARAQRFRKPTSRNQHVVGRGMARRLLGEEHVSPESICFAEQRYGKPYVVSPDTAKQPFNVAHTDGLVMCGVAKDPQHLLGVDVECLCRQTDPGLAERYFSRPEVEFLNRSANDEQRRDMFLRIWTLKESFIKAIGTGLQTPLADFAFVDIASDTPGIRMLSPKLNDGRHWKFFSIQPRPGFIGAVAFATKEITEDVSLHVRCFDDLIA